MSLPAGVFSTPEGCGVHNACALKPAMTETVSERASFTETETRHDEMHRTITEWIEDLTTAVADATTSAEFQRWLDVQSRFHEYSHRNTLLISLQYPEATRVAGYRTWQEEFDRQVSEGESAIWIWAPLMAKRCPACENARSYHESQGCSYDETPPEEWERGLVGFNCAVARSPRPQGATQRSE